AKTLRWSNDEDVFSLDPYARQEIFLLSFDSNIYEPLVRRGRDLRVEPALAVRWQQQAPDRWRFELRRWDIMSAKWCAEHDATEPAKAQASGDSYASDHADGTGPFMLEERQPDKLTVLVPNPNWWDQPQHNLDRVEFRPMTATAGATAL